MRRPASQQFTAFLQALIKAVESTPNAALVLTLAVGKDAQARDAYREEHERALGSLTEAEAIASRKATQLNPTEEDETTDVLRCRLFEDVDLAAVNTVCDSWSGGSVRSEWRGRKRPRVASLFTRNSLS